MDWLRILAVISALLLPIIWGVVVHRVFEFLEKLIHGEERPRDGSSSDYQI